MSGGGAEPSPPPPPPLWPPPPAPLPAAPAPAPSAAGAAATAAAPPSPPSSTLGTSTDLGAIKCRWQPGARKWRSPGLSTTGGGGGGGGSCWSGACCGACCGCSACGACCGSWESGRTRRTLPAPMDSHSRSGRPVVGSRAKRTQSCAREIAMLLTPVDIASAVHGTSRPMVLSDPSARESVWTPPRTGTRDSMSGVNGKFRAPPQSCATMSAQLGAADGHSSSR